MRQLCKLLFVLLSFNAYAEDMIDPSLITPLEKYTIINIIKPEPIAVKPDGYIGYERPSKKYDLNSVLVNSYALEEINGVYYKVHRVFRNNRWEEILVKE